MKALDLILQHYKDHKRQWVDVPEWRQENGKPLRIYWDLMTVAAAEELGQADPSLDLDIFVRYARDASGQLMFADKEDKLKLRVSADQAIISRVARLMVGPARLLEEALEQAEKN